MDPELDPEALSQLLDQIHDIAAKASTHEGIPDEVDAALSDIIALSRYKFDVVGREPTEAEAYEAGRMSIIDYDADAKNPYSPDSPLHDQWSSGRKFEDGTHQRD